MQGGVLNHFLLSLINHGRSGSVLMGTIRMILVELRSFISVEDVAICVFSILKSFFFFLQERENCKKKQNI